MQDAYEAFNRALKSNEQDPRAYHGIAEYYSQKGKRESALDNFAKALKYYKDPEKKNCHFEPALSRRSDGGLAGC